MNRHADSSPWAADTRQILEDLGVSPDRGLDTAEADRRRTKDGSNRLRAIMHPTVVYCYDDQDLDEVARLMKGHQIRRLVVLNRDKRLVGICSLGDLVTDGGAREMAADVLENVSQPAH